MRSTGGSDIPLALRMRPRTLDGFIGQKTIVGSGTILRRTIEGDMLTSMILWGPPGSGKTTLASITANMTKAYFVKVSAVTATVADVRKIIGQARERKVGLEQRTIMLLDEVHRFNKAQQDTLLPAVEEGTVILIGTTTENPYFSVNAALISRSRVFQLSPLSEDEIKDIMTRAIEDKEHGLGTERLKIDQKALDHIIRASSGDARSALNALEVAVSNAKNGKNGMKHIDLAMAQDAVQKRAIQYDRAGEAHYDTISAFIKSMRGSDPQAAIYWLARMIYAGEDPRFIARRMVIFASEDVGNADPQALIVATAAAQAVEFVGMPEARLNLAQAAIYLATALKSNSAIKAIDSAISEVKEGRLGLPPKHLRNPAHPGLKEHGYGKGYKYPHDYPGHVVEQEYLPEEIRGKRFYEPSDQGLEKDIGKRLKKR